MTFAVVRGVRGRLQEGRHSHLGGKQNQNGNRKRRHNFFHGFIQLKIIMLWDVQLKAQGRIRVECVIPKRSRTESYYGVF